MTKPDRAVEVGERICAAVGAIEVPGSDEPDFCPSHRAFSIGAAFCPADGQTALDLLKVADLWMSHRQAHGRRTRRPRR
jgi:GGDEF domain-containing protein